MAESDGAVTATGAGYAPSRSRRELDGWQRGVWAGVACALAVIVILLLAVMGYTLHSAQDVFIQYAAKDRPFTFTGMTLITASLLRLLAIFFGAALSFGGLVVSFYVHEHVDPSRGGAEYGSIKASLKTNSPGIAAIVVGAIVIVAALYAMGDYDYEPPPDSGSAKNSANAVTGPATAPRNAASAQSIVH